jgi:signal recognition particle GTPase
MEDKGKSIFELAFGEGSRTIQLNVRISPELNEVLEAESKRLNQSVSDLVRDWITLPLIPEIMKKKHALSTEDQNLIKECKQYMSNLSESFKEVTQRQYLIEKVRVKIEERLTKDDVKKMLIEDIAQKIIKDLFN